MAAKLKVDELESVDGSTNLILNNSVTMAATKTLPAASLTGALPAISAANLTAIPAANITGTIAAVSGVNLTALNATNLGSGTVPTARLGSGTASSSTFLRGDGSWQTAGSTSASDLTSGTLPMARLSGTLPALNASALTAIPAANITGTLPAIDGSNLTGVSAQGRNLIINGGFDVWQRGTSATHASSYLADRWKNYHSVAEAVSRQAFTPGQTDVDGFPTYYARHGGGSAAWYVLDQRIENVRLTAGKEVTISYWMKGSSAFTNAGAYTQNFGSGGSGEVFSANLTHSITTSWAKHTTTWTMPSITGKTIGANNYLMISILRANLTNVTVEIANVQLEIGGSATDFEQRTYAEELRLCQRYYQRYGYPKPFVTSASANFIDCTQFGWCLPLDADDVGTHHILPVEMRTTPTCSITESHIELSNNYQNYTSGNTLQVQSSSSTHMTMHFDTAEGLDTNHILVFSFQNAAGFYDLSAEL